METAFGVEPPVAAVDAGSEIGEVIGAAAVGAELEVVVGFGFLRVGEIGGGLGAAVAGEEMFGEDLAALVFAAVKPELGDAGEVADGGAHAAIGGAEAEPVFEAERGKAGVGGGVGVLLEDAIKEGLLVEIDGEVVVGPGCAGGVGAGVTAGHVGEVAEGHGAILFNEGPALIGNEGVDVFDLTFRNGKEEEGAENGFGGGEPVAHFGLIAPGMDGAAVDEYGSASGEVAGEFVECGGARFGEGWQGGEEGSAWEFI